ncbi:MAG: SCO family protein [Gammaproteobacteria bacterium]
MTTNSKNMDISRITQLSTRLLLASILCISVSTAYATPTKLGGDFELTSHKGEVFHLSDIKGKVGIIFFGFTHCPDVCPNTLLEIQRLIVALEDQAEQMQVLFISVDPKRDTPDKLDGYVTYFNNNIIGLTGSEENISKVLKQFNASVKFSGDTNSDTYNVDHTANMFLINKQGEIGSIILPRTPFAVLEQQVRKLMEQ